MFGFRMAPGFHGGPDCHGLVTKLGFNFWGSEEP